LIYESGRKLLTNKIVPMATAKHIKPTESELEILRVLWDKGTATVREVHEILAEYKDAGYTTTLKLMQIMFEKGIVKRDDSNKTHIYRFQLVGTQVVDTGYRNEYDRFQKTNRQRCSNHIRQK